MKAAALPSSPTDMNLEVMWRLLHLTFWLSAVTTLLFMWIYIQRGQSGPALADAIGLGATALGYWVSVRLGRPKIGVQAIAIVDWLLLAVTITLQGGLRSPQLAWMVVLAPLLMLAGLKLAMGLTAGTVAMVVGWYVAETSGWMPLYREAPLSQRAVSAVLITCLFALAAWYALRWRTRLGEELKVARDTAVEANRVKDRFIANPLKAVPGTAMGYAGVADGRERADLIAYLREANASAECASGTSKPK